MSYEQVKELLLVAYQRAVVLRKRTYLERPSLIKSIEQFAQLLTNEDSYKFGALFSGTNGNGKTTLLYAFQYLLIFLSDMGVFDKGEPRWEDRRRGIWIIEARDLPELAKDEHKFNKLKQTLILGIDDLGEDPDEVKDYGNIRNPMRELIEYRYHNQLFTVATTNQKPTELNSRYKRRVSDRMREMRIESG